MNEMKYIIIGTIVIVGGIISLFFTWPIYNVWASEQSGRAKLAEATYSRQIAVEEAKAKLDSEKLNATAEVERAKGVSESNRIVKSSIDEQYIRYLWVKTLDGSQKQVIYIPTEAGIPVTEAGRAVAQ